MARKNRKNVAIVLEDISKNYSIFTYAECMDSDVSRIRRSIKNTLESANGIATDDLFYMGGTIADVVDGIFTTYEFDEKSAMPHKPPKKDGYADMVGLICNASTYLPTEERIGFLEEVASAVVHDEEAAGSLFQLTPYFTKEIIQPVMKDASVGTIRKASEYLQQKSGKLNTAPASELISREECFGISPEPLTFGAVYEAARIEDPTQAARYLVENHGLRKVGNPQLTAGKIRLGVMANPATPERLQDVDVRYIPDHQELYSEVSRVLGS